MNIEGLIVFRPRTFACKNGTGMFYRGHAVRQVGNSLSQVGRFVSELGRSLSELGHALSRINEPIRKYKNFIYKIDD